MPYTSKYNGCTDSGLTNLKDDTNINLKPSGGTVDPIKIENEPKWALFPVNRSRQHRKGEWTVRKEWERGLSRPRGKNREKCNMQARTTHILDSRASSNNASYRNAFYGLDFIEFMNTAFTNTTYRHTSQQENKIVKTAPQKIKLGDWTCLVGFIIKWKATTTATNNDSVWQNKIGSNFLNTAEVWVFFSLVDSIAIQFCRYIY